MRMKGPGSGFRVGGSGLRAVSVALLAAALGLVGCGSSAPAASSPPAKTATGSPSSTGAPPAAAAPAAAPAKLTPVTIAIPAVSPSFVVLYAARDLGIFKQHGLKVTIENIKYPVALAGMISGSIPFETAATSITRSAETGKPVKVVFIAQDATPFAMVGAKGITSFSQLKGKTVTLKSPEEEVTAIGELLLQQHGLAAGSYKYIDGGTTGAQLAEVTNGEAQAAILPLSLALKLAPKGYHTLATSLSINVPASGVGTSNAEIKNHPGVVRKVVASMIQATSVFEKDPAKIYPVISKDLRVSPTIAKEVYTAIKPIERDGRPSAGAMKRGFALDKAALTSAHASFHYPFKVSQVYDFAFLPKS